MGYKGGVEAKEMNTMLDSSSQSKMSSASSTPLPNSMEFDKMGGDMTFTMRVKEHWENMTPGSKVSILMIVVLGALSIATVAQGPSAENTHYDPNLNSGDTAWLLAATALVLLMTPGLAFFYGGMVDKKNILYTMFQSISAIALITLLWTIVGFSLAWGDDVGGVIGSPRTHFLYRGVGAQPSETLCPTIPLGLFSLFHLKFAIITPPIISGAFTDRIAYIPYCLFIVLFSLFVYCPMVHWVWHPDGFLRRWGVLDFAGGTVVETASGWAGLAGSIVFNMQQQGQQLHVVRHNPHIPFIVLGTSLLWFGWFGFNAGSSLRADGLAVESFMNTNCAACAAMITWLLVDKVRGLRPSVTSACVGAVVGLVAITPACGFVNIGGAFVTGVAAAMICNAMCRFAKASNHLDDQLEVWPAHGIGGSVGLILTGLLADKNINVSGGWGLFYGHTDVFFKNLTAAVGTATYSFVVAFIIFRLIGCFMPLSPKPEKRLIGLDQSFHGESVVVIQRGTFGRGFNSMNNMRIKEHSKHGSEDDVDEEEAL